MKKALLILGLCYLSLAAFAAAAHNRGVFESCEVEFRSNVSLNDEVIQIATDDGAEMTIRGDDRLYVNGDRVNLDDEEIELVTEYAREVRSTVPEIVAIALEGVEIGLTAVTEVFYAFSDDGPPASLQNSINLIQEEVSARMYREGNTVHLKGGEIAGLESVMNDLEPALEEAISDSVGDLVMSIGRSLKNGEGTLGERIASLGRTAKQLESDIEEKVKGKADLLEERAESLCEQVHSLQVAETKLHREVPETREFNLVI